MTQRYCELAVLVGLVWTAAYIFVDGRHLGVEPEAVEGGVARRGYVPTVVSCLNAASIIATYAAVLATNVASAIGTVAFLVPIAHSWPRMFGRIRERYQVG